MKTVTGASNGMGLSMTDYLLTKGDAVIAAVRNPESMKEYQAKYGADRLLVVKVDVQKQEDVDAAFKEAEAKLGRIDVVYNNAGYSAVGEVEAMPLADGKDMFEVLIFEQSNFLCVIIVLTLCNMGCRPISLVQLGCLWRRSGFSARSTSLWAVVSFKLRPYTVLW